MKSARPAIIVYLLAVLTIFVIGMAQNRVRHLDTPVWATVAAAAIWPVIGGFGVCYLVEICEPSTP